MNYPNINNFSLSAYPNPFNSAVRISLDGGSESPQASSTLPPGVCRVEVFDVNGRRVERIPPAPLIKGGAEQSEAGGLIWRPDESIGSGVYLVRATVGGESVTKRIVFLK